MKYVIMMLIISNFLQASLPKESQCDWFLSDSVKGIRFNPEIANMGLILPQKAYKIIVASCTNAQTQEKVIVTAQHLAFFEGEKIFSSPSFGMLAPRFSLDFSLYSQATLELDRTIFTTKLFSEFSHLEAKATMKLKWQDEKLIQVDDFEESMSHTMEKSGQMIPSPNNLLINEKDIVATSQISASNFTSLGSTTWEKIETYMDENVYIFLRKTRLMP